MLWKKELVDNTKEKNLVEECELTSAVPVARETLKSGRDRTGRDDDDRRRWKDRS